MSDNSSRNFALGAGLLGGIVIGPMLISIIILCFCIGCCVISLCMGAMFSTMTPYSNYNYDGSFSSSQPQLVDLKDYLGESLADVAYQHDVPINNSSITLSGSDYKLKLTDDFDVITKAQVELTAQYCSQSTTLSLSEMTYFDAVGIDYLEAYRSYSEPDYTYNYNGDKVRLTCNSAGHVVVSYTAKARG